MLELVGGFHVGPLFIVVMQRPLVRPLGKAQTKRATPPWVQRADLDAFYAEARRLTRETGELHVVDHIVPKIGKTVCGLHVPANLRVIHWRENARKGAWTWPGMWGEQMEL